MKVNIRSLFLSILDGIMFISSLTFKYNDYTKTYYILSFLSYIILIYLIINTFRKNKKDSNQRIINKILRDYKDLIIYAEDYNYGKKRINYLDNIEELEKISKKNKKPIIYYKKKEEHIFLVETKRIYVYKIGSR